MALLLVLRLADLLLSINQFYLLKKYNLPSHNSISFIFDEDELSLVISFKSSNATEGKSEKKEASGFS